MKFTGWIFALLLLSGSALRADVSPEKRAEIDKMLQLTGVGRILDQVKSQLLTSMQSGISASPDFWVKFGAQMDTRELVEAMVPVYDRYYTLDDLKAINGFYTSPAGQKIVATLPQIMQEASRLGQQWSLKMVQKARDEVAADAAAHPAAAH